MSSSNRGGAPPNAPRGPGRSPRRPGRNWKFGRPSPGGTTRGSGVSSSNWRRRDDIQDGGESARRGVDRGTHRGGRGGSQRGSHDGGNTSGSIGDGGNITSPKPGPSAIQQASSGGDGAAAKPSGSRAASQDKGKDRSTSRGSDRSGEKPRDSNDGRARTSRSGSKVQSNTGSSTDRESNGSTRQSKSKKTERIEQKPIGQIREQIDEFVAIPFEQIGAAQTAMLENIRKLESLVPKSEQQALNQAKIARKSATTRLEENLEQKKCSFEATARQLKLSAANDRMMGRTLCTMSDVGTMIYSDKVHGAMSGAFL